VIDRAVVDKNVRVGRESIIGSGDDLTVNPRFPEHYRTGITVIGKNSVIPTRTTLGRNVCVMTDVDAAAFRGERAIPSGSTVEE
ncbi:glucose-1-phosphate adenylyltransferase, partial [bacterium]|nr:glucose-1-phosphate adenylyltransferase [bacterium]